MFRARVENVGDTDLVLDAKVDLDAFLGTASRSLDAAGPESGHPTLPYGERELRMAWNDPPLLGWFRPELVVEVAFDGVQASTRYPGGVTLRFARVLRYREDKTPAQADTLAAVRALAHAAHQRPDNPSVPLAP